MKNYIKYLSIFSIILILFTGCSKETPPTTNEVSSSYYPIDIKVYDDNGTESTETIKCEPKKVVVLGEALGEYMLAFGQKEKIIGLGYIDGNELLNSDLGSLNLINKLWPSRESILALDPDLIYSMSSGFKEDRIGEMDFWRDREINVLPAINFTVARNDEEYTKDLINFGKVFNIEENVSKFLKSEDKEIAKYKNKLDKKEKVLFLSISSGKYYYCPPKGSMMDDLIENIGGEYIKLSNNQFIEVSKEGIIKANPDKIILAEFQGEDEEKLLNEFLNDLSLKNVKAIKNKDILMVNYTSAVRGDLKMSDLYKDVYEFLINGSDIN